MEPLRSSLAPGGRFRRSAGRDRSIERTPPGWSGYSSRRRLSAIEPSGFSRDRQLNHETATHRSVAGNENPPAMRRHDVLDDRQSQPRRSFFSAVAILREALEDIIA